MLPCSCCDTATDLTINGLPVCPACAAQRQRKSAGKRELHVVATTAAEIRKGLIRDFAEASQRAFEASEEFDRIMSETPNGIPHPDEIALIHNASKALSKARQEMFNAHQRLHAFMIQIQDNRREPKTA